MLLLQLAVPVVQNYGASDLVVVLCSAIIANKCGTQIKHVLQHELNVCQVFSHLCQLPAVLIPILAIQL
jgi:hypothetical protein